MKFFKSLFGSKDEAREEEAVQYSGFSIQPTPKNVIEMPLKR